MFSSMDITLYEFNSLNEFEEGAVLWGLWNGKPITVEYELTPHGKTLEKIIREIGLWGTLHRKKIVGK
jgi:DNA-binding HxlR family transcriptional regulator